jgi:hypothetical protein
MTSEELELLGDSELSLLETLDHVLSLGLVVAGEITISVANIDLIFVGVNLLVGSTETVHEVLGKRWQRLNQLEQSTDGPPSE